QYIREFTSDTDLAELAAPHLSEAGFEGVEQEYLVAANNLMKERVSFIPEFVTKAGFLFSAPGSYDEKMSRKQWKEQTPSLMEALIESFSQTENWESETLSAAFEALVVEKEVGKGKVMAPLRLALTGVPSGPGVFDIAELIGKEETIRRIQQAIARLS
ncbi:MAG: glutamate--tRNA ligase, partial [Bacteroidota bacterium]